MTSLLFAFALAFTGASVSKEVTFKGQGGMELAGTLVMPANHTKPCPAVLFLSGSGPTDRDGNSMLLSAHVDIHKQVAERLAEEGIASLRFDKRAIMRYSATWPKTVAAIDEFFSWDKFVGDAKGGISFLRTQTGIDPKRVGMIGHSEGGILTLQVAHDLAGRDSLKAIVLLGTTGRPMGPVIHEQLERNLKKASFPATKYKALMGYADAALASLKQGQGVPPNPPTELAGLFSPYAMKLMTSYCQIDPAELASAYSGPVLIMNGGDDTQVDPTQDTPLLKSAFDKRKSGSVAVTIVPKASHNFKSTAEGDHDAFAGPVVPLLPNTVAEFLKRQL